MPLGGSLLHGKAPVGQIFSVVGLVITAHFCGLRQGIEAAPRSGARKRPCGGVNRLRPTRTGCEAPSRPVASLLSRRSREEARRWSSRAGGPCPSNSSRRIRPRSLQGPSLWLSQCGRTSGRSIRHRRRLRLLELPEVSTKSGLMRTGRPRPSVCEDKTAADSNLGAARPTPGACTWSR